MARSQVRRPGTDADWWLDLVLAGLLLGAGVGWATYLTAEPSPLDLVLCMTFLLAGGSFACQGTVGLKERTHAGR